MGVMTTLPGFDRKYAGGRPAARYVTYTGGRQRRTWTLRHGLFTLVAAAYAFVAIVLPNSIRSISFPLFVASAGIALLCIRRIEFNSRVLVWLLASTVTMFYVGVGWYQRHTEAWWQVPFVYAVSPGMWLLICSKALRDYPVESLIRVILLCGAVGATSVFVFYYVFINIGPDPLRWLMNTPNLQFGEGVPAATMYVFGSLMFVAGGFCAAPQLVGNLLWRFGLALLLVAAALLSGRSALMLSIVFGGIVFLLSLSRRPGKHVKAGHVLAAILFAGMTIFAIVSAASHFNLNVADIIIATAKEVFAGGGEERVGQFRALIEGIRDTWMLGAGHGIGVSVIRDEQYPWRYELLWLVTIYRVGIAGALIYFIPVAVILVRYAGLLASRRHSPASDFMFGGFIAAFLGAATNPYYESFEFQWMLILPFVFFILHGKAVKRVRRQPYFAAMYPPRSRQLRLI